MREKEAHPINFSNQQYILEMYALYQQNPQAVENQWKAFFQGMEFSSPMGETKAPDSLRIKLLIEAYKRYGHLISDTNPMISSQKKCDGLEPHTLGFEPSEMDTAFPTLGLLKASQASLKEIIKRLQEVYCGQISYECYNIDNSDLEAWFHQRVQSLQKELSPEDNEFILLELYRAKELENFLQKKFLGAKRFSVEGAEAFLPMIKELFALAAQKGYQKGVIGMAHRGRINVLANVMGKPYKELFQEFNTKKMPLSESMGDVKYHNGYRSQMKTRFGNSIELILASNPSHLESVDPVVIGITKALEVLSNEENLLPLLIHGDASIAGQGVVYETAQLAKIKGYSVGGAVHIVINNQVGFTATAEETRSTRYCTDIAKTFGAPVIHVNSENPSECFRAIQIAFEARDLFKTDVFIDLQCHRLWGHNEADEPMFTNPDLYKKIKSKDHIYKSYSKALLDKSIVTPEALEAFESRISKELNDAFEASSEAVKGEFTRASTPKEEVIPPPSKEKLMTLVEKLFTLPENFEAHPKIIKLFEERLGDFKSKEENVLVGWATAELLAYADLLEKKVHIRISGQDSVRGTFSHRHARIIDQQSESSYIPLEHISPDQAPFTIYNSALSEFAVMGFEFGYSITYPNCLVIWEAQFGDFANGAQIIIDQYLAGCETKWGIHSPLTLFLPHGHEGMGSEHTSCRIERFLQLAGLKNWRICYPSTPAQFFHLIRDQALRKYKRPLVIATPKELLRQTDTYSKFHELYQGRFEEVIDDSSADKNAKRILFCSGKISHELIQKKGALAAKNVAVIRIEQLYPLNTEKLKSILKEYTQAKEFFYVQEEPQNQGAYSYIEPYLTEILGQRGKIQYKGRKRNPVPDTAYVAVFKKEQEEIVDSAVKETN